MCDFKLHASENCLSHLRQQNGLAPILENRKNKTPNFEIKNPQVIIVITCMSEHMIFHIGLFSEASIANIATKWPCAIVRMHVTA